MERLGIYIFFFFFFGICFFERVRTHGETGSLYRVLFRNLAVLIFAVGGFFLIGYDLMFPAPENWELFRTAREILSYRDPYGEMIPGARFAKFMTIWLDCLFCATATLIVAAGIWELRVRAWSKWILVAVFSLLVYPVFGLTQSGYGFLGRMGFYDHALALGAWVLPSAFVLGARLFLPRNVLPNNREHHLKGTKILPGMKHRFIYSRGIGFMMVFLILSAQTLINLPFKFDNTKMLWVMSKTLTLIPASLTMLFSSFLFFGLFGRNNITRVTHAPPFFALMAALVATQACNQYGVQQAIITAVTTTFIALLCLRMLPLNIRIWDPLCSVPIFLVGGSVGILMASLTPVATLSLQAIGLLTCLVFGMGIGGLLIAGLRQFGSLDAVEGEEPETALIEAEAIVDEPETVPEVGKKKKKLFGRNKDKS